MADVTGRFELDRAELSRQSLVIMRRQMASITRRIATQAKLNVPVDTGHLGRSIKDQEIKVVGPFKVTGGVLAGASYAAAVHEGTRPHVIRARRAPALSFVWHGEQVFFRSVHHPGTKARPFLANAASSVVRGLR